MPFKHPQGQFYLLDPEDFGSSLLRKLVPVIRLYKKQISQGSNLSIRWSGSLILGKFGDESKKKMR